MNKIKIFNDPIHGIIRFDHEVLYDIIDHPIFQRLRRIKQMGLSSLVYPGANHTRFEHALGALHLMTRALKTLREKKVEITNEEYLASCVAILCHDIGHGPFSHALEYEILPISHEKVSLILMKSLEKEFGEPITQAIEIFTNTYSKRFLCQLVSSQLDIDRLDYLTRDSFFSGVVEGKVGYDRLIMMLNVDKGELVIEEKGIASVERFLLSRHMMYSQVYLHKTAVAAEQMLKMFLRRCVKCYKDGINIIWNENIFELIKASHSKEFNAYETINQYFIQIDDGDVVEMLKKNQNSCDLSIKILSKSLLERKLFKVYLHSLDGVSSKQKFLKNKLTENFSLPSEVIDSLIIGIDSTISVYDRNIEPIYILMKDGTRKEFSKISKLLPNKGSNQEYLIIAPKEEYLYNI